MHLEPRTARRFVAAMMIAIATTACTSPSDPAVTTPGVDAVVAVQPPPRPVLVEKAGFHFGRFGDLTIVRPDGDPDRVVLFVSATEGWNDAATALARPLAASGALVAGIDYARLRESLDHQGGPCAYLVGEFEDLGRALEVHYRLPAFRNPLLAGLREGAALAYAMLVQQPPGTFTGGLGIGFVPVLAQHRTLCPAYALRSRIDPRHPDAQILEAAPAPAPWRVLLGDGDRRHGIGDVAGFLAAMPAPAAERLRGVDAGYAMSPSWQQQLVDRVAELAGPGTTDTAAAAAAGLGDLSLVEVPATDGVHDPRFAIIYSGDGGWAGLDREMADALGARGIPVVGLSTLKYFWKARTPDQTAADLDRIIRHYAVTWSRQSVVVIGYSFGGAVLPFLVNRLPDPTRAMIDRAASLAPGLDAEFEFHPASWLATNDAGLPIAPEIERIGVPFLCIRDDSGETDACEHVANPKVRVIEIPGGHHFGGNYQRLADEVMGDWVASKRNRASTADASALRRDDR